MHPVFIVQADGIVVVSDGTHRAAFPTLADFAEAEPGQLLIPGIAAVNFERRGDAVLAVLTLDDGSVAPIPEDDWPAYDAMIAKAEVYAGIAAAQKHPLYKVADLEQARAIMVKRVVAELENHAAAAFSRWSAHERSSFEQQLAEAEAFVADETASTPLLDAILLPGESKTELVQSIVTHASAFKAAMGALLGAKRAHLSAIYAADIDALNAYDVTAGWPA